MEQHESGITERQRRSVLRGTNHQSPIRYAPHGIWRAHLFLAAVAWLLLAGNCELAVAQQSEDLAEHARRAAAAISSNDAPTATRELLAMLKLEPANASIYANLGMVEFSQGQYPESARNFELALLHAPSLYSASAFLGMAKIKLGAPAEGQKLLEEAFPHVTDRNLRLQAGFELVKSYSESGMLERAVPVLSQLQALDPFNQEVLYSLYSLHSEIASEALHKLTSANPDSAWVHQVLGRNFMAQEQYAQAVQEFRKAIDRGPHLSGLHYQLGEALLSEARTDQNRALAENEFKAELRADPQHTGSLLKLAEIALERSSLDKAKSYLDQALTVRPDFAEAHALAAKILDQQGNVPGAISELEKAEKLAPEAKTTHYQLAQLYRKQGRTADADREAAVFRSLSANDNVAADKVTSK